MTRSSEWLSRWIPVIAASLYFIAVVLRTWLFYQGEPPLGRALGYLLLWGLLIISEPAISKRWPWYFYFYLFVQTSLVFVLISLPSTPDFMGALLGVLSMQVMLRLAGRIGALWIGVCAVTLALIFFPSYSYEAIAFVLIYTAGSVFFGSYIRAIRRAQAARLQNQALAADLEKTNRQLQEYSTQVEQLAAARERNRLARELHDSVTQTAFSMNLTSQSAALLLPRDPGRAAEQLERLYTLSRHALGEMQVLIEELKPEASAQTGLSAALRRLAADSRFAGALSVAVESQGDQMLPVSEQQSLLRIAQEALNNTLKHAQTTQATIRLHLVEPYWMEIEDHGRGFDLQQAQRGDRLGLVSMAERAAEIGWKLRIDSSPGAGTRIRVEKPRQKV
jgi:signal transduction histidine kinase